MSSENSNLDSLAHVRAHYHTLQVDPALESRLAAALEAEAIPLAPQLSQQPFSRPQPLNGWRLVKHLISYSLVASAAAGLTLGLFGGLGDASSDVLAEIAILPSAVDLGAEFDLEGDATALDQMVSDTKTFQDATLPQIPVAISSRYYLSQGRLVNWSGNPVISVSLEKMNHSLHEAVRAEGALPKATLFIVKLDGSTKSRFPSKKVVRKVAAKPTGHSGSATSKNVVAWREGDYGFAYVEPILAEENAEVSVFLDGADE